jgi:hypothetical protein
MIGDGQLNPGWSDWLKIKLASNMFKRYEKISSRLQAWE